MKLNREGRDVDHLFTLGLCHLIQYDNLFSTARDVHSVLVLQEVFPSFDTEEISESSGHLQDLVVFSVHNDLLQESVRTPGLSVPSFRSATVGPSLSVLRRSGYEEFGSTHNLSRLLKTFECLQSLVGF